MTPTRRNGRRSLADLLVTDNADTAETGTLETFTAADSPVRGQQDDGAGTSAPAPVQTSHQPAAAVSASSTDNAAGEDPTSPPATPSATASTPRKRRSPATAPTEPAPTEPAPTEPAASEAALIVKQTTLREDQIDELSVLARRLERSRPRAHAKRITENTIIRVAVDAVLAVSDDLTGITEEEILASVRHRLSS